MSHAVPAFMQTITTFKLTLEGKKLSYKAYNKLYNIFQGFYTFGFTMQIC